MTKYMSDMDILVEEIVRRLEIYRENSGNSIPSSDLYKRMAESVEELELIEIPKHDIKARLIRGKHIRFDRRGLYQIFQSKAL